MFNILSSKPQHYTLNKRIEKQIQWKNEFVTNNQLIPSEYLDWYEYNMDNLENLKLINPKEYYERLNDKLKEIYEKYESDNTVSNFNQYMSKNSSLDLNHIVIEKDNLTTEYMNIALDFFRNQHSNLLITKLRSRMDVIQNLLTDNFEAINTSCSVKFLEHYDAISSIVYLTTKTLI